MGVPRAIVHVLAVISAVATISAAGNARNDFAKSWENRSVVLRRPLYTLTYKERGLIGNSHDKRDGLFVVTPFKGTYYQFDGRQSHDDIRDQDPQRLMDAVRNMYQADSLNIRSYAKVEPVVLTLYSPGVELFVNDVRIERDRVRLLLSDERITGRDAATALTIQWPTAFSRDFSEREAVENLVRQIVNLRQPS